MTTKLPLQRARALTVAGCVLVALALGGFLFAQGYQVNLLDKALYEAAQRGDSAAVINLLDRGANPQYRSASGETACDAAEKIDRKDIVHMIGIYGGCTAK
ncbi:MAG: ankyrin repeat domain-containing protein [Armatimonadetes bacterium]|nr:ankyrin repeat domain-containing protein [Armatimonadota bacterium]